MKNVLNVFKNEYAILWLLAKKSTLASDYSLGNLAFPDSNKKNPRLKNVE